MEHLQTLGVLPRQGAYINGGLWPQVFDTEGILSLIPERERARD